MYMTLHQDRTDVTVLSKSDVSNEIEHQALLINPGCLFGFLSSGFQQVVGKASRLLYLSLHLA